MSKQRTSLATPHSISLLRHLVTSTLTASPSTALFFAERLYSLDSSLEIAVFLLALTLEQNQRPIEAIWALRQLVTWQSGDEINNNNGKKKSKPAIESSLRCARLYSVCCSKLNRNREARDVLSNIQSLPPSTLIQPQSFPDPVTASPLEFAVGDNWVIELEIARLAKRGGEHEQAIESFLKVLESNPWCWEALEGLCAEGVPPDPETLFPPKPRPVLAPVSPVQVILPQYSRPPHPPPLGPSQTAAVNSPGFYKPRGFPVESATGEGLGFFTPSDTASPNGIKGKTESKGGLFGMQWKKNGLGNTKADVTEMSLDESASFDSSFYPTSTLLFAQPSSTLSVAQIAANAISATTSLFTPPTGVKRARGQPTATLPIPVPEQKSARRAVKAVPAGGVASTSRKSTASSATNPVEVRRSTRLSRDVSSNGAPSSSTSAVNSKSSRLTTKDSISRDKKRSKSGQGPSVLSDGGSDALSPRSRLSSSPPPSSPALNGINNLPTIDSIISDPGIQEAEDYVGNCLRLFGKAICEGCVYQSPKVIEALQSLPLEQQKSWRSLIGIGKAHFEMLNYEKAEKAFAKARQLSPHLLESMELYSTLLWHLGQPTSLSFLAQDLMIISPKSPSTWIAAGNVFSNLEDSSSALKCFKRASQLDDQCVYAFTLSGHECVVLEEWERALGFFREAVKRDGRHYNAWFGLGNVYMQTGKYRLAEYHFRKAVDINPTNAMLICCVGSVLEKLGQRQEALILYEKACILAPDSPAVRFKRVRILIALKEYRVAEKDLLLLKDRAPNEFNVNFLLGKLYLLLHRRTEAVKYFTFAQELDPRSAALLREQLENERASSDEMEI